MATLEDMAQITEICQELFSDEHGFDSARKVSVGEVYTNRFIRK